MKGRGEVKQAEEVEEKSGGVAAFFDLDGTLLALPSLEQRFFRMLRYRGAVPVRNYFLWLREAVRLAPLGTGAILQANKMYLRGVAVDRTEAGGLKPGPTFFGEGINRVAWHARQEHVVVLVSGTLEPLAEEVARVLEAELAGRGTYLAIRVCATRLEETHGRWTGRIVGDAMFGEAKARTVKTVASKMKLDLARCYAYGDSATDRWMLATVGRPAAVNPSREFEQMARKHGWALMEWNGERNLTQRTPSTRKSRSSQREGGAVAGAGEDETQREAQGEKQSGPATNHVAMSETRPRSLE